MAVIDHYYAVRALYGVVHYYGHYAALLLGVEGFLGKFAIVPFGQDDFFCFVRIWYVFINAVFEDSWGGELANDATPIWDITKVGYRVWYTFRCTTIFMLKVLFQWRRSPDD